MSFIAQTSSLNSHHSILALNPRTQSSHSILALNPRTQSSHSISTTKSHTMSKNAEKNPFPPSSEGIEHVTAVIEKFIRKIGFGKYVENCEMRGGSNNNVVMFQCTLFKPSSHGNAPQILGNREHCILRTMMYKPRDTKDVIHGATKRVVALVHAYGEGGSSETPLPIPAILAYDASFDNPIKCPYIIQRKAAGETLEKHYRILDSSIPRTGLYDLGERLKFAEEIAKFIEKKESSVTFSSYGIIDNRPDMASRNMGFIGSSMQTRIVTPVIQGVVIPTQPDFENFIGSLVNAWSGVSKENLSTAEVIDLFQLKKIFDEMNEYKLFRRYDGTPTIWHPDLYPRNVMFHCAGPRNIELTAVVDWDHSLVLPRLMTRVPPYWLWDHRELFPDERKIIKRHFYDLMEKLVPGYRWEAEDRSSVLVRALSLYALRGPSWKYLSEISFRELAKEWEEMRVVMDHNRRTHQSQPHA
ncbi:hypothetical protein NHQ30_003383 [Ciborinia camelliae]|nr:hypothetical protein NHQ30_003383 [Ciborinia camelliae]